MSKDNTVIDAITQTMRCDVCGDEVPAPLGSLPWVSAVMLAFSEAHAGESHGGGRTRFSTPTEQSPRTGNGRDGA